MKIKLIFAALAFTAVLGTLYSYPSNAQQDLTKYTRDDLRAMWVLCQSHRAKPPISRPAPNSIGHVEAPPTWEAGYEDCGRINEELGNRSATSQAEADRRAKDEEKWLSNKLKGGVK